MGMSDRRRLDHLRLLLGWRGRCLTALEPTDLRWQFHDACLDRFEFGWWRCRLLQQMREADQKREPKQQRQR
jgi:hypothetical protein